jgi:hypothetical protein
MNKPDNPYQAPKTNIQPADTTAEKIRLENIRHETSIKSIGFIYYLTAFIMAPIAFGFLMVAIEVTNPENILIAGGLILMIFFLLWTARKLRQLKPTAKIPSTLISIIGLLAIPIGPVISLYTLYAIYCKKGRLILSNEYREIIDATPDIRYQTSIIIWIALTAILLMIATAIIIPMVN